MNPFLSGAAAGGLASAANTAANSGGWNFLDMLKGAGNSALGLFSGSGGGTPTWLQAAGLAGGLYSGLQQQKAANKALQMQQDAYNFNKMLSQREIDRQDAADKRLYDAYNASTYAR